MVSFYYLSNNLVLYDWRGRENDTGSLRNVLGTTEESWSLNEGMKLQSKKVLEKIREEREELIIMIEHTLKHGGSIKNTFKGEIRKKWERRTRMKNLNYNNESYGM